MSSRLVDVETQLSELEMLRSMYPDESDIVMDDLLVFSELRKFAEDDGEDSFRILIFTVKLRLQEPDCTFDVEFTLGVNYPSQERISALIR